MIKQGLIGFIEYSENKTLPLICFQHSTSALLIPVKTTARASTG